MTTTAKPDSLRQLRYAAIASARAALKAGSSYQITSDCIARDCPSFVAAYDGDELAGKILGVIRFAANQLRVNVPS